LLSRQSQLKIAPYETTITSPTKDGDAMLKIFSSFGQLLSGSTAAHQDTDAAWVSDPLRHPDIARMDARELGDLPFPGPVIRATTQLPGDRCGA
jgi:hypothetical protein